MCLNYNTNTVRQLVAKAGRMTLKDDELKTLTGALKTDPELVFHIGMTPQRLPSIVINNVQVAYELLIHMNNTKQITKYYDVLCGMKLSPNTLEVFNLLSTAVELP